ncbi:uncharacterized protein LACBIDRAFT_297625 [Laccaria bicolor S238N-H82]|uniref:Predicted protein n=1 Tax=Laccaria bicolor (strain S238N-H82 / ATCC MYA-4686) TaxID=486041 RepID=B0DBM4_LACBS|nr:uncharacterized protein LACBIDRAFT_297625 [Laccaria bicolor S238N-H82]EDR08209.1 predicted protein [Laccaria bicolor S238N-H82]|eukprot:XP_001881279.1 predicted protein [Laccaria bicolor S238N-H82]
MARFRAYASDSSSDEEEPQRAGTSSASGRLPDEQERDEQHESESDEGSLSNPGESSGSSSSSSDMDEDELIAPRTMKSVNSRGHNALVEDKDGEIRYAHEVDVRVSPPSTRSSPPSNPRQHVNGNPTIIPWAQQIGVDAQKMHVMQTSLFRMPEAAALRALNQPTRPQQTTRQNLVLPAQSLNRKHSRDSDGDGLRFDSRERASFAHDIEPPLYRPSRKYARVEINSSIANGKEGIYVDAGLAMGRSFRVGWGPGGTLLHLGSICGPLSTSAISANSSVVTLTKILSPPPPIAGSSSALASKLLQHHLSHTPILPDDAGVPFAYPSPSPSSSSSSDPASSPEPPSSNPLSFDTFASLFPTTDSSSPAALFRLGSALFDPLNLHLGRQPPGSDTTSGTAITPDLRNRITLLRRKTALSKWLKDSVKQSVDRDLRAKAHGASSTIPYTPADTAFTHLTGHQVEQACNAAADGGYLKLSTLISQAGGDAVFKEDARSQVEIWKNEKLTPGIGELGGTHNGLVGKGVWKVYRLLGGLIDDEPDAARNGDDLCAGLDWKRVFGLYLWYGTDVDATIADIVRAYEPAAQTGVARPLPTWILEGKHPKFTSSSVGTSRLDTTFSSASRAKEPDDPLFALIKLHADPALSLSHILDPLSFAPSGLDWGIGMCWHLYVILSRVMRVRDFVDRGDPAVRKSRKRKTDKGLVNGWGSSGGESEEENEEDGDVEGHSPTADLLASSYAFELESWGMIQEAVFVLLHIEGSVGREKAIKALLARSAPKFDEWMTRGIVGSLKIPMAWVDEAKAMYALDQGDVFRAYELYTSAGLYNLAHDVAVLELAPEAVIRRDLGLLKTLFVPFDKDGRRDKIDGWIVRGKVFLDYIHIMTRLPELYDQLAEESGRHGAVPDASQQDEIEDLSRRVPRLIDILPNVLHGSRKMDDRHPAALEEMVNGLLGVVERANPLILSQIQQLGTVDGAAKIGLVRGMGLTRFLRSVGA